MNSSFLCLFCFALSVLWRTLFLCLELEGFAPTLSQDF